MRSDGTFRTPPRTTAPLSLKLMVGGIMVAVIAGVIAFAALAIWLFAMALPVIVVAGLFAWGMMKYRRWQMTRSGRVVRPY